MSPKSSLDDSEASIDWDWIGQLDPDRLEEDDLAKFVSTVATWKPSEDVDQDRIIRMFQLSAAALKSRDADLNKVLEALAEKESEKDAQVENEELKKENKDLKNQIKKLKKVKTGQGDEALEAILELEQNVERLEKENRDMDLDLERERAAKDNLEKKVAALEKERKSLRREIDGMRDELADSKRAAAEEEETSTYARADIDEKRLRELEDTVRIKNKQIHQLLEDIEQVERDGMTYQTKVVDLRDQLADATKQMNTMAGEYLAMKDSLTHHNTLMEALQEENAKLKNIVEENLQQRAARDAQLDEIGREVEKRIDHMRAMIDKKDMTIEELRSRLNRTTISDEGQTVSCDKKDRESIAILTKALTNREEQIEELQEQLKQASNDLESSAKLIEDLTASRGKGPNGVDPMQRSLMNVRGQLQASESRVKELEDALADAEEIAKDKTEELSEVISRLRAYERGHYGLEDAVDEVNTAKKHMKMKDKQIEELTNEANNLQQRNAELCEENADLREKLGMEIKEETTSINGSSTPTPRGDQRKASSRQQQERALVQVMQREIERLEEERIQLKIENRKMARQLGHRAAELELNVEDLQAVDQYRAALKARRKGLKSIGGGMGDKEPVGSVIERHEAAMTMQRDLKKAELEMAKLQNDVIEYKTKYEEMLEENDQLRNSLQEILDSIHEEDGRSDVAINAPSLEKVLTILDARHVVGQYHPAMALKARVEKLEAVNAELRDQLRKTRLDEERVSNQLQKSKAKVAKLELEITSYKESAVNEYINAGQEPIQSDSHVKTSLVPMSPMPMSMSVTLTSGSDIVSKLNAQLIQVLDQLQAKEDNCKNLQNEIEDQHRKVSVIRHQMGLLYEEFHKEKESWAINKTELENNIRSLNDNLEGVKAKLMEYEDSLEAMEKGELEDRFTDATRKIALLRSNEAILVRRYQAVEESEAMNRKEAARLKEEIVNIENGMIEKIGALQRYKEMSSFKIDSLQKSLSESVPASNLEEANREYADLTAKYRDLLQKEQFHSAQDRRVEELELSNDSLKQEKVTLISELQSAKEKLHSLEALLNRFGKSEGNDINQEAQNHQIKSLTQQIATLEMRELNEKQRADHLENKCKLIQGQVEQLEKRNNKLEDQFSILSKANLDLQKTERELRDQLVTSIPKEEYETLSVKVKELDESSLQMKLENEQLREVTDVARNQIDLFESRRHAENMELESLRHAIIDLQTLTDEKALIGKLHRHIISLQQKDSETGHKMVTLEAKVSRLEAQLLKANKRGDEKESLVIQLRSQSYIKSRSLIKVIQDLRRQFSGCVPLSKQEKLSQLVREATEDRWKTAQLLLEAEIKQSDAEIAVEELRIKRQGVDELESVLKQGSSAATKQVLEWHKKLEDLRLQEMRSRKIADRLQKENIHLQEMTKSQSKRIDQLEEESVRIETQMEQRQLDWEVREVELECIQQQEEHIGTSESSKDDVAKGSSLSKQLQQTLDLNKSYLQKVENYKIALADAKKTLEDVQKKVRDAEAMIAAKDRIINDLRLQVPASVDRALAMASVTGGSTLALSEDYETKRALNVAQQTIGSLRDRLAQKEETLARYEKLLKQTRSEHEFELKQRQEEIANLKSAASKQSRAYSELKMSMSASLSSGGGDVSTSLVVAEKISRIRQLEEDILELQSSLDEVSRQLAESRNEAQNHLRIATTRQKDIEEMKENFKNDSQMRQLKYKQDVDRLANELKALKHENGLLKGELQEAKDASEKAPSAVMSALVEKLRADQAEKEKKLRAMGRAMADLKQELMSAAQEGMSVPGTGKPEEDAEERKRKDREIMQSYRQKVDELSKQIERLQKQVSHLKERELTLIGEVKNLKEEVSRKGSLLIKMKEEKLKGSSQLTSSDANLTPTKMSKEKEEMKNIIRQLEDKLRAVNRAEKPLEDSGNVADNEKALKTTEELARWEESKKWKHKTEVLNSKLKDANTEVSKLSKTNKSLREINSRLEREKLMLEGRVKTATRDLQTKTNILTVKVEELTIDNLKLRDEIASASHEQVMGGEQGMETLKLRNKFLMEKLEAQEKKISAMEVSRKVGSGNEPVTRKLLELQESDKQRKKLEETNLKLRIQLDDIKCRVEHVEVATEGLNAILTKAKSDPGMSSVVLEIQKVVELLQSDAKAPLKPATLSATTSSPKRSPSINPKDAKNLKILMEEVQKLKTMNEQLLSKVEDKNNQIKRMEHDMSNRPSGRQSDSEVVLKSESGQAYEAPSVEEIRRMEADLKRKTDLLSEVKVLLKQAADRERSILAEKTNLETKLKLMLEIDPKTPSEALAKELRQTRLTVERLQCEKKELEFKLSSAGV